MLAEATEVPFPSTSPRHPRWYHLILRLDATWHFLRLLRHWLCGMPLSCTAGNNPQTTLARSSEITREFSPGLWRKSDSPVFSTERLWMLFVFAFAESRRTSRGETRHACKGAAGKRFPNSRNYPGLSGVASKCDPVNTRASRSCRRRCRCGDGSVYFAPT